MTFPFPTFSPEASQTTTAEYTGSGSENPGSLVGSPRTIAGIAIGSAVSTRYVVAAVMMQIDGGGGSPTTGVTIGGVTAAKIGSSALSGNGTNHVAEFWIAAVPTGTTADVVVSFTGSIYRLAVSCFKVLGYSSVFDSATNGTTSTIAIAATINARANGCVIACVTNNGASSYTWTNLTERVEATYGNQYTAASDDFAAASPGLSITATQAVNNSPQCISIVSL